MKKDFFDALNEVYIAGGIGNTLLSQFYEDRLNGGSESQFVKLAVYMEWKYGITHTKQIKTEHIYELLELLKKYDFKDTTLKNYISAFRNLYKWNKDLFSDDFAIPTYSEFTNR